VNTFSKVGAVRHNISKLVMALGFLAVLGGVAAAPASAREWNDSGSRDRQHHEGFHGDVRRDRTSFDRWDSHRDFRHNEHTFDYNGGFHRGR
jgi:hypothetical protein